MYVYLVAVEEGEYWQQWFRSSWTTCENFPQHDIDERRTITSRMNAPRRHCRQKDDEHEDEDEDDGSSTQGLGARDWRFKNTIHLIFHNSSL
jgi:hypothetical protein